jgi:hypothetical protein
MLDVVRFLAGLSWAICLAFLSGSIWRFWKGTTDFRDRQWIMCWFFAVLMTGYWVRLITGLTPQPESGASYQMTLGLQVLSLLIALRIINVRIETQGWRW